MEDSGLKILMVTSEVVPFAKAGGLGDMVAALAAELSRQGHDVRIVLPRYYSVDIGRLRRVGGSLSVPLGDGEVPWEAYLAAMEAVGYDGYFTIERQTSDDPVRDVLQAKQFLEKF